MFNTPPAASFHINALEIYWYGLLITLGIFVGYVVVMRRASLYNIDKSHLENLFLIVVPSGIIGARLYHVVLMWEYYSKDWMQVFNLRAGGLAIHGAILGAILAMLLYAKKTKLEVSRILDLVAPSMALGHSIGRWGNYFNQELYGSPTDLPWKVYIDVLHRLPDYYQYEYFHPTFLYESLLNLTAFFVLLLLAKKIGEQSRGRIFGCYLIIYGCIRFFTEMIRIDEVSVIGPLKIAQIASLGLIVLGSYIVYSRRIVDATKAKRDQAKA